MRTRAPALAAVVAFALAVAAVTALAGRGGGTDGRHLVKLPVASAGGMSADETAAGAATAAAPAARSAIAFPGVQVTYRVEGDLPDLPATAPAYRLASTTTADAVGHLAASLGLVGTPTASGDGWLVRDGGRELRVESAPGLPWYLGQACPDSPVDSSGATPNAPCAMAVTGGTVSVDGSVGGGVSSTGVAVAGVPVPLGGTGSSSGDPGSAGGCPSDAGCVVTEPVPVPSPAPVPMPAPMPAPVPVCAPGPVPCAGGTPICRGATLGCLPAAGDACPPDATCVVPGSPPASDPPAVDPGADAKPQRPAGLPSEEDARRLAREAFARLGVGTGGLVVDDGWFAWQARVEAVLDGMPVVGLGTSLAIGPNGGIVGGSGYLAAPDRIGDYPLVGVEAGLKRLNDGFGFGFGPGPRPMVDTAGGAFAKGVPEPAMPVCADPAPGCAGLPAPDPVVQVITGVHLALFRVADTLVPAYVFGLAGGGDTAPVPAVTDQWLDQARPVPAKR